MATGFSTEVIYSFNCLVLIMHAYSKASERPTQGNCETFLVLRASRSPTQVFIYRVENITRTLISIKFPGYNFFENFLAHVH